MNTIKFRIAAKTDVGLVRTNNEDNFQASADLMSANMCWVNNEICSLGEKGALLVVADGMGGMNAGEVASEIAIRTVRESFRPENLVDSVTKDRFSVEKFMNSVIVAADAAIKNEAKLHPESRGMGTTVVIGWMLGGKLYVSWCGDSRAYVYNPVSGLHQITKDHSYVQQLVDMGKLSREDAFDYPESNIITRSLSDGTGKAKPDSLLVPYDLCDNDIIMLCTDGLSGMIRDNEIEQVIKDNVHDMSKCVDALIGAACDAEGSDNITICLCQIVTGGAERRSDDFAQADIALDGKDGAGRHGRRTVPTGNSCVAGNTDKTGNMYKTLFYALVIAVLLIACGCALWYWRKSGPEHFGQDAPAADTIAVALRDKADGTQRNDSSVEESQPVDTMGIKDGSSVLKKVVPGAGISGRENKKPEAGSEQEDGEDRLTTMIVVKKGETLSGIAERLNVTVDEIKRWNNLKSDGNIKVGDTLKIEKRIRR